jgi:hypothetical protein
MTGQDEDHQMQSTPPSPSVEMSAEQEWSSNSIASQNSHHDMPQSSPTWEKAVRVAKPNIKHLTPSLHACLMCQLHKRRCDYGYPGQTKNDTKPHSKNLPCTREYSAPRTNYSKTLTAHIIDCRQTEEKQRSGDPLALYCFYPKPCENANNGCGRCGSLREQQLMSRPRSIWKDVKRKFRTKDQRWWKMHTRPTIRPRDSNSWRNPVTVTM